MTSNEQARKDALADAETTARGQGSAPTNHHGIARLYPDTAIPNIPLGTIITDVIWRLGKPPVVN